jgi:hypothetical protein
MAPEIWRGTINKSPLYTKTFIATFSRDFYLETKKIMKNMRETRRYEFETLQKCGSRKAIVGAAFSCSEKNQPNGVPSSTRMSPIWKRSDVTRARGLSGILHEIRQQEIIGSWF